jgi:hypothetical protein
VGRQHRRVGESDVVAVERGQRVAVVGPARFEETYDRILGIMARELGCPVVLITPFFLSADRTGG